MKQVHVEQLQAPNTWEQKLLINFVKIDQVINNHLDLLLLQQHQEIKSLGMKLVDLIGSQAMSQVLVKTLQVLNMYLLINRRSIVVMSQEILQRLNTALQPMD